MLYFFLLSLCIGQLFSGLAMLQVFVFMKFPMVTFCSFHKQSEYLISNMQSVSRVLARILFSLNIPHNSCKYCKL